MTDGVIKEKYRPYLKLLKSGRIKNYKVLSSLAQKLAPEGGENNELISLLYHTLHSIMREIQPQGPGIDDVVVDLTQDEVVDLTKDEEDGDSWNEILKSLSPSAQ